MSDERLTNGDNETQCVECGKPSYLKMCVECSSVYEEDWKKVYAK
jgi:hypothetical protein